MLCLTPFHKRFVMASQGVSSDKITVTRNGIKPNRFEDADFASATNPYLARKNPNKIVFPSSPDRGLDRAMIVLDEVRKTYPDIELHVFYGIEHLHKWGHAELQQRLKTMMEARPWVKYHGATQQDVLMDHFKEAAIWLHPCDFIESSCITAMEMVCAGVYPVTRRLGGLQDTLAIAEHKNMATLLDSDCVTPEEFQLYVNATLKALDEKAWERVSMNAKDLSWSSVAQEWVDQIFPKPEVINGIRSA
jgi:glycosyltransferase involved in cell wall biosynthesis